MTARVAVIVLNWNSFEVTADCLRSLQASSFAPLRVILVDNGSHDGSASRLGQEFPEIELIRNDRNLGFTGGMNAGLRRILRSECEFALLLNNDTIVDRAAIAEMVACLDAEPDIALACPKIYFWDVPEVLWFAGGRLSLWTGTGVNVGRRERDCGQYDRRRDISFANGCVILVRRSALEALGLLDDSLFAYAEDTDYSFRALRFHRRMVYVPSAKVWHREGFASKQNLGNPKRIYYGTRNQLLVMRRHARPWHWCTFLPYFLVNWVGRFVYLSIARQDQVGAVAREILRGATDSWRMGRGQAPRWGEPRDWGRTEGAHSND